MGFDFVLVDVFTDRPFGGNQLAVFPDAVGIADETMQQLAREFNFSETTFVLPPADPAYNCRVRIFTPRQELPFAGHPTVGTAAVLASMSDGKAVRQFVFEEGIGPVSVAVNGDTVRLHLRSPRYESSPDVPPAAAIARALALPEDAIADSWYAGIGLRFCFVRLADRELVDRAVLDKAAWADGVAGGWSPELYFFASDVRDGAHVIHARFFAPAVGIDEDPATGSACASLAASIAHRSPERDGTYHLRIDQGVAMGRPSALEGTAYKMGGQVTEVAVGGQARIVGHGTMTLSTR
ncbi:MAG TPA: PhzF family phenazine biosynthesis protein [Streptosporangiaceae bacterium]|nr:PhzF family phenazine biosynthesis protein [Streptosporangiaceae bacterium]